MSLSGTGQKLQENLSGKKSVGYSKVNADETDE